MKAKFWIFTVHCSRDVSVLRLLQWKRKKCVRGPVGTDTLTPPTHTHLDA